MLLKDKREEKGLKQDILAFKLGVTTSAISYYENYKRIPNPEVLLKLAKILEVSVEDILIDYLKKNKRG